MAHVDEKHWSKLQVIHCGIDPESFTAERDRDSDGLELLSAARLTQAKGHAVLLQALEELSRRGVEVRLTIVGEGPKRCDLERLARELGVDPRIRFEGAVGRERIHEYYRRADVFCLPSFAEGVPVVLMEAMATELPVVATDVMGVRELVDDGVNGLLVRPSRPDLLADAIGRLARDADLRRRLGAAGRETVQREFDIRRSAEQIHGVFDEVLGLAHVRRPSGNRGPERRRWRPSQVVLGCGNGWPLGPADSSGRTVRLRPTSRIATRRSSNRSAWSRKHDG